jgi:hypothetical protein
MRGAPLAVAILAVAVMVSPVRGAAPSCVTTDPVVVLGQTVLPSETVCVPPQVGLSAVAAPAAPASPAATAWR